MKESAPPSLDELLAGARDDFPSDDALSRLADRVDAAQATTAATSSNSILRTLARPRLALLVVTAATFGIFGTTRVLVSTTSPAHTAPAATPAAPAEPQVDPVVVSATSPVAEIPSIDVRSLPSSKPADVKRPSSEVENTAPAAEESESSLLNRAHAAVSSNPDHALSLTAEHSRRFARGMLVQEREVIAVEALARLGRTDEARARATMFHSNYPNSAYRRRIDAALDQRGRSPAEAR